MRAFHIINQLDLVSPGSLGLIFLPPFPENVERHAFEDRFHYVWAEQKEKKNIKKDSLKFAASTSTLVSTMGQQAVKIGVNKQRQAHCLGT